MHIHAPLVRDIRNFLDDNDWNVEVGHTYREADSCADKLAKSGHNFRLGVKFFERLPPLISLDCLADASGLYCLYNSFCA